MASLSVTDDGGAVATQVVRVGATQPNQVPVAIGRADPPSGPSPLSVIFYADGSYDPDGFLGNIHWRFNDFNEYWGAVAYNTFSSPGTYPVTLEVFDARGAIGRSVMTVEVTAPPCSTKCLRSTTISLKAVVQGATLKAQGKVLVKTETGAAVKNASVEATWTRPDGTIVYDTVSTNAGGVALFQTTGGHGTYVLAISTITKSGSMFDPANSVLSKSITK